MKLSPRFTRSTLLVTALSILVTALLATGQDRAKRPREETLLNGLKVLMWSDPTARDVSVKIRIHAGSAFDPQGKEGVMRLLAENIFPNAESREYFAEGLNGSLKIDTTYDYIQINASSEPSQYLAMLETLSSALINSTIDKPTTAKLRDALAAELTPLEGSTTYVADQAAISRMFGSFPYGRPVYGTTGSVKKIDFADLIDARARFLTADNATLIIVGNFKGQNAWQAIRRFFGGWLKSDRRVPSTFRQPDAPQPGRLTVASPRPNESAMRFAVRFVARNDKEFAAANVFAKLVEKRLLARSPEDIRDEAFVRVGEHVFPGAMLIGFAASRGDFVPGSGKIGTEDLVSRALTDAILEAEFAEAKSAALSEWAKRDTANLWLDIDTFKTAGVNAEFAALEKVSIENVRSVAARIRAAESVSVLVNTPKSK